jgi:hypothetical protein
MIQTGGPAMYTARFATAPSRIFTTIASMNATARRH